MAQNTQNQQQEGGGQKNNTNARNLSQKQALKSKATFQTISNSVNGQMQNKLQLDWYETAFEYGINTDEVLIGVEPTATALSMAIVRLHSIDDQQTKFKDANLSGIFCFIVDRKLKSRFFRLYDINTSELLFQCELYIGFKESYKMLREKFHYFQLHKTVMGVEYSNLHDALYFKKLVEKFTFVGDPQSVCKEQKKKMGVTEHKISLPGSFSRVDQPGWNPSTQTFNLKEMPSQLKTMLKKGGFKKKHLKNKESAVLIYELLLKDVGFAEQEAEMQGPVTRATEGQAGGSHNPTMIFDGQNPGEGGSFFARGSIIAKPSLQNQLGPAMHAKVTLMKQQTQMSNRNQEQGDSQNNSMNNSKAHITRPQPPVAPGRGIPAPPGRGGARPPPRPRAPGARGPGGPPRPAAPRPSGGSAGVPPPTLSLADQLKQQAMKLKKNDVSQAPKQPNNSAKYGMTKHQEMKLTTNMATLHAQLQARKKALGNDRGGDDQDSEESDDSDDDDDLDDDSD